VPLDVFDHVHITAVVPASFALADQVGIDMFPEFSQCRRKVQYVLSPLAPVSMGLFRGFCNFYFFHFRSPFLLTAFPAVLLRHTELLNRCIYETVYQADFLFASMKQGVAFKILMCYVLPMRCEVHL
jgi:hypothetical protein